MVQAWRMVAPPSTISVWPVMRDASVRRQEEDGVGDVLVRGAARGLMSSTAQSPSRLVVVAGPDIAGGHRVDADAVAAELVGEGLGQGDHARLGCAVGDVEAGGGDCVDRGEGHDGTAGPLFTICWPDRLKQGEDLRQVVLDRPVPILVA